MLSTFHNRNVTTLYQYNKLNAHSHNLSPLREGGQKVPQYAVVFSSLSCFYLISHSTDIYWTILTSHPPPYPMFPTKWWLHAHPGPVLYSYTPPVVKWRLGTSKQVLSAHFAKLPAPHHPEKATYREIIAVSCTTQASMEKKSSLCCFTTALRIDT